MAVAPVQLKKARLGKSVTVRHALLGQVGEFGLLQGAKTAEELYSTFFSFLHFYVPRLIYGNSVLEICTFKKKSDFLIY